MNIIHVKSLFDSNEKMKNFNLTDNRYFLNALLEKITCKVYYINDKNLEMTRQRIVNLIHDEIYSI